MKTTLVIDDEIMTQLKLEAARRRTTISGVVETALRMFLRPSPVVKDIPPLPTFRGGKLRVDICDRDKLYDVLEED